MTSIEIRRYADVAARAGIDDAIDAIFFEASNTKSFASEASRAAFRARWLGRYLVEDARFAHIAFGASGAVIGYIVGAVDDPARSVRFADIAYFASFAHLTKDYPAHLHVNVAPGHRNLGVGARLIAAFVADVQRAGVAGVHVVTGAHSRNVQFYNRNGFAEVGRAIEPAALVFLGRSLA